MQQDLKELAALWITAAQHDLIAARELLRRLPHTACFHAQQAAEKALKAALITYAGDAPRTHIVSSLIQEIGRCDVSFPEHLTAAGSLDQYYLPTRYPDALGGADAALVYNENHATAAIAQAEAVLDWAQSRIES